LKRWKATTGNQKNLASREAKGYKWIATHGFNFKLHANKPSHKKREASARFPFYFNITISLRL